MACGLFMGWSQKLPTSPRFAPSTYPCQPRYGCGLADLPCYSALGHSLAVIAACACFAPVPALAP